MHSLHICDSMSLYYTMEFVSLLLEVKYEIVHASCTNVNIIRFCTFQIFNFPSFHTSARNCHASLFISSAWASFTLVIKVLAEVRVPNSSELHKAKKVVLVCLDLSPAEGLVPCAVDTISSMSRYYWFHGGWELFNYLNPASQSEHFAKRVLLA